MLSRMSSRELTEWMAYFKILENPDADKPKPKASEIMRAMYGNRIVRKENGRSS